MPVSYLRGWVGLCATLAFGAGAQAADAPRYEAAAGLWFADVSGSVTDNERLDLEDDLALRSNSDLLLQASRRWGRLELQASHARLRANGRNTLNRDITLGDLTLIPREETVFSQGEVDDSGLLLRWSFGGERLRVSPGVMARYIDATVRLQEGEGDGADRTVESLSELFPMAHLAVSTHIGMLALEAGGNYVEYGGDRVFDVNVDGWLQPQAIAPLRIGVGWQLRDYRIESSDGEDASVRMDGVRLQLGARW